MLAVLAITRGSRSASAVPLLCVEASGGYSIGNGAEQSASGKLGGVLTIFESKSCYISSVCVRTQWNRCVFTKTLCGTFYERMSSLF